MTAKIIAYAAQLIKARWMHKPPPTPAGGGLGLIFVKRYSSSILESCFLVVTGTASQFGEVYFPLRPLCVFDYNENCCQNDVTASGRPLRVEGLDFLDGQPLSFGNFLIGQLAA